MSGRPESDVSQDGLSLFSAAKRQLEAEIRADVFAGRSSTAGLRQDQRRSLQEAISGPIAPGALSDHRRGPSKLFPLAELVGPLIPDVLGEPIGRLSQLATWQDRIDRLELLERELARLLAHSAPQTWREIRRPIIRLLRRARRALRAQQRIELQQ